MMKTQVSMQYFQKKGVLHLHHIDELMTTEEFKNVAKNNIEKYINKDIARTNYTWPCSVFLPIIIISFICFVPVNIFKFPFGFVFFALIPIGIATMCFCLCKIQAKIEKKIAALKGKISHETENCLQLNFGLNVMGQNRRSGHQFSGRNTVVVKVNLASQLRYAQKHENVNLLNMHQAFAANPVQAMNVLPNFNGVMKAGFIHPTGQAMNVNYQQPGQRQTTAFAGIGPLQGQNPGNIPGQMPYQAQAGTQPGQGNYFDNLGRNQNPGMMNMGQQGMPGANPIGQPFGPNQPAGNNNHIPTFELNLGEKAPTGVYKVGEGNVQDYSQKNK